MELCARSADEIQVPELKRGVVTFSATMSACEKGGVWRCALGLLDEMRGLQLKFNEISLNAALSACEKGHPLNKTVGFDGI